MRKLLHEALRRVLSNLIYVAVILVISRWRIILTTTSIRSLKKKHGKVDAAVFKNVCNWSKRMHQPIFEVYKWDHVVHKEVCSKNIRREVVRVPFVAWKVNELLQEFFRSFREAPRSGYCPKATDFASSEPCSILRSRKRRSCHWWYVFGPNYSRYVLVHESRC